MRFIYVLKNPENGEIRYVGQTNNLKRRYNTHILRCLKEKDSEYDTYKSRWLRSILSKNMKPIIEVIETCENLEQSNIREKYWIDKLSQDGKKLTNSQTNDVTEFSDLTKEKMSNAKKGKSLEEIVGEEKAKELRIFNSDRLKKNNPNKSSMSEVREKISNTLKEFFSNPENHWAYGKKMSEKHNEKLRLAKINNPKNVGNKKSRTDEQKKKISEKLKGSKVKRSEILQFDMNGLLIKEWKSMREIERETDLLRPQISRCCKGLKECYAGFIWKYKD